jgi:hypothetical protein
MQEALHALEEVKQAINLAYADGYSAGKQQREWVGLTPEEILDLFDISNVYGSKWIEFARAVEAKLRSKNDH